MGHLIHILLTEEDVRAIVDGANGGNALGECPMNENVAVAIIREYADEIAAEVQEHMEDIIGRLADRYARIERLPQ